MDKYQFIQAMQKTYQAYEISLKTLSDVQMLQPRTCGDWSIKEVIAHVTWYEREMVSLLTARVLVGSSLWDLTLEERNAAICAGNETRSLQDILLESRQVHQRLMELLQDLSEQELLEAACFREMPADWIPWQVMASNTFEHYAVHTADILIAFNMQVL